MKITDHTVLRYLERVAGMDIEGLRRRIEDDLNTPRTQRAIESMSRRGARLKIKTDRIIYCIRDGVITTCYPR